MFVAVVGGAEVGEFEGYEARGEAGGVEGFRWFLLSGGRLRSDCAGGLRVGLGLKGRLEL